MLKGTSKNDVICAGAGDDIILAGAGNDVVFGGAGNDLISGQDGHDALLGGPGADTLLGGLGLDALGGESGDDILDGGANSDAIFGGPGADTANGADASDLISGDEGDDRLTGGSGDDLVSGGPGKDLCDGGPDKNIIKTCEGSLPSVSNPQGDADNDQLPNAAETAFGSDPTSSDADKDGLTDLQELDAVTSPVSADTDADGLRDDRDDTDADEVTNAQEFIDGTNPANPDTDGDGLSDGEERKLGTSATKADTDGDGLDDLSETKLGTSPTKADTDGDGVNDGQEDFDRTVALPSLGASLKVTGSGAAVLAAQVTTAKDERLADVPGRRGPPVEVVAPGVESGTLTLQFDATGLPANAELAVLHFNTTTGTFDRPARQDINTSTGTASVTTDDFSPFIVVDVKEFETLWKTEIQTPRDGNQAAKAIDTALTLDSSGSMLDNDPTNARLTASKLYVDAFLPGDRGAVVDFDDTARLLQPLTEDKAAIKVAIDSIDSSGGTDIGAGLKSALDELDAHSTAPRGRVVVLLTDGQGSYDQTLTTRAINSGTTVYTVGLGSGTDQVLLDDIATRTGGKFYLVADAADLPSTFDRIGDDLGSPDTDKDGLADAAETAGLRDGMGLTYVTDPNNPDTDGDGLTDGEEAGTLRTGGIFGVGTYFSMTSDPTKADTDGDGLTDADEVDSGLKPRVTDTDADGLDDFTEIEIEFDPLVADADGDGRRDDREFRDDTDPFAYDLSNAQKAQALIGGAVFGDAGKSWAARKIGRIGDEVVASTWYLAGWLVGGYFAIGDVRDLVYNLAKGNWGDAALSAIGIIPFAGDAVKTGKVAVAFSKLNPKAAAPAIRWLAKNIPTDRAKSILVRMVGEGIEVRLLQDLAVRGKTAPRALKLSRPIGKSVTQNAEKDADIQKYLAQGATDFRVNQWQVGLDGKVLGINRPDLQFTLNGKRYYIEYDTRASGRGPLHKTRIEANDPGAVVELKTID